MARTSIDTIGERDIVSKRHVRGPVEEKFGVGYKKRKKRKGERKKIIKQNKK